MAEPEPMPNRGRIQAQGGNVEKSVAWGQDSPPTKTVMQANLDELYYNQLTKREREVREGCYEDARLWIKRAPRDGYPRNSPTNRPASFVNRKRTSKDIGIDIEINAGVACVDDPKVEN